MGCRAQCQFLNAYGVEDSEPLNDSVGRGAPKTARKRKKESAHAPAQSPYASLSFVKRTPLDVLDLRRRRTPEIDHRVPEIIDV